MIIKSIPPHADLSFVALAKKDKALRKILKQLGV